MDKYFSYTIYNTEEALLGLLSQFPFESFEETEQALIGYIPQLTLNDSLKSEIDNTIRLFTNFFEVSSIEPQNWNAIWEESFQPVVVGNFCQIRADFHPFNPKVEYDLMINPKMAFGTGHHATTYMMIEQMSGLDFGDKLVFDYGCGTGILAILADKMGAKEIDAVDIEKESYLNVIENSLINQTKHVHPFLGDIHAVPNKSYDIILANINRNILIQSIDDLSIRLRSGGFLLLSGILVEDVDIVLNAYKTHGFVQVRMIEKDSWSSILLKKS